MFSDQETISDFVEYTVKNFSGPREAISYKYVYSKPE